MGPGQKQKQVNAHSRRNTEEEWLGLLGFLLWMDKILHHLEGGLRQPCRGASILGAGVCPSTVRGTIPSNFVETGLGAAACDQGR